MLDEVSRNFGFKELGGASKSTLIPHHHQAAADVSKHTTQR
jgi:hypothetical protein